MPLVVSVEHIDLLFSFRWKISIFTEVDLVHLLNQLVFVSDLGNLLAQCAKPKEETLYHSHYEKKSENKSC